jgi:ATP-dependent Lon protease
MPLDVRQNALLYHASPEDVVPTTENQTVTMANTETAALTYSAGAYAINGVALLEQIPATNGRVFVISGVLRPPTPPPLPTLINILVSDPQFALTVEQLRADLEHSRAALATATDQIKELQSHAQQRAKEIEALKTACANMERQLERESFAHRDALAQAQAQAAQELLAARALADRDRQALALKIDQERQQQSAALRSAMSELAASGQRSDALTEKLAQVQADHARAQAQAQSLQAKVEQLQSSDRRLHVLAEALGCLGAAGLSLTVARGDRKKSPDTFKKVCEALGHWAPEALPGGIEILARQLVQPTAALPPDRPAWKS